MKDVRGISSMGRRRTSSAGGTVFLVVFGLLAAAVSAVYRFVVENAAAISAFVLVCGGIILSAYLLSRRKSQAVPALDHGESSRAARQPVRSSGPTRQQAPPARWIPLGERARVGNAEIASGLFYLGGHLPGPGRAIVQYAINPALPVAAAGADIEGNSMPYWPSYSDMSPAARRAFLDWMRDGRRNPAYGIGHVFVFFYGLEHRLFVERGDDAALLVREVERLLTIYGTNNSFRGYATTFVTTACVWYGARLPLPPLSPERAGGPEMDIATRLHLGERLAAAPSLSAEDALRWALASPDTYLRTPALRCFEEFVQLWNIRFVKHFPAGLAVNAKSNISLRYRAASAAFEVEVVGPHQQWPDVSSISKPLDKLQGLVAECTDELDTFSRFVGRKPALRNSMVAAAMLPDDLQRTPGLVAVGDFRRRLVSVMGEQGRGSTTAQILFEMAGIEVPPDGKISAAVADDLGRALDSIDVAIEPDRRYGSSVPRADEQVFVFKAQAGGPVDAARTAFTAMRAQVEVAVLAAGADGDASFEELQRTIARIRAASDLSGVEQARLIAFAVTTFNSPPKRARVMRKLAEMGEAERRAIAGAAFAVVGDNPTPDVAEVKFLERLHKSLGLPKEAVYEGLHQAAAARSDEPIAISEEKRVAGVPIPKESALARALPPAASRIRFDAARLARTRQETDAVSALLSGIFEEEAPPPPPAMADQPATLKGLDGPHTELLELLELRGAMSRSEFDRHAREMRLLPDGAIERINDWSFDRFDEALIEEGDEVAVAPHLRDRIAEIRESAA
ncbi:TerB N-terminal domain-containing protein [Bradyrhizobium sp. RDI18]|uniref:tellurite resistance TerB family protein n=1 Tax=Bradyrhizobium sp. RDI18 TaxID=3367400 RepID=UPI0037120AA7